MTIGPVRIIRRLTAGLATVGALALAALTWWAIDRLQWPALALATGCVCIGLGAVLELRPSTTVHSPVDGAGMQPGMKSGAQQ